MTQGKTCLDRPSVSNVFRSLCGYVQSCHLVPRRLPPAPLCLHLHLLSSMGTQLRDTQWGTSDLDIHSYISLGGKGGVFLPLYSFKGETHTHTTLHLILLKT